MAIDTAMRSNNLQWLFTITHHQPMTLLERFLDERFLKELTCLIASSIRAWAKTSSVIVNLDTLLISWNRLILRIKNCWAKEKKEMDVWCVLIVDAMALHNSTIWDPKTRKYVGTVDYGTAIPEAEDELAKWGFSIHGIRHVWPLETSNSICPTKLMFCCSPEWAHKRLHCSSTCWRSESSCCCIWWNIHESRYSHRTWMWVQGIWIKTWFPHPQDGKLKNSCHIWCMPHVKVDEKPTGWLQGHLPWRK